jgi:hypothetical protein
MINETKLKKIERGTRLAGETGMCFLVTYGQMFLPRLGDLARSVMTNALNYNLLFMSALYATDLLVYTLAVPAMYDGFLNWGKSRMDTFYQRGMRDLSQMLVNAGGMQLFYYALLSNALMPQIATTVGLVTLKGIIESVYEAQEYHTTHNFRKYDVI